VVGAVVGAGSGSEGFMPGAVSDDCSAGFVVEVDGVGRGAVSSANAGGTANPNAHAPAATAAATRE